MSAAGLGVVLANIVSSFNPKVSRKGDRAGSKAVAVANIATRFKPRVRRRVHNMANRTETSAAARPRAKERKAKLPQRHLRSN